MRERKNPIEAVAEAMALRRETYEREVLQSPPFQDALRYLEGLASDFLLAQSYIRLMAARYGAAEDYLLFRFAPHLVEAVLATTQNAKEGLQNAARRELRFLLEACVKFSTRDVHAEAQTFDARLRGLDDREKRFEDYVRDLQYFPEFERPGEANAAILSLYAELSTYVHAAVPQFQSALNRYARGEDAGRESVATLNRFNKLAFQVYDLVLVQIFQSIGLSMAGDAFVEMFDDMPQWRFHKGKFIARLSKCFDYKHERQTRHKR